MVALQERIDYDEISTFLDARYASAPEAAWRLFEFAMHQQSHTIIQLAIHLLDQQNVYFTDGHEENALHKADKRDTYLTVWFKLNDSDEDAWHLLYSEIPSYYTFDSISHEWKKR